MGWQVYRVELEGQEPQEVATNARDWAAAKLETDRPMDGTFRVVHAAMVRQRLDVPRHYDQFLDVLAAPLETVEDDPDALDPTPQGP